MLFSGNLENTDRIMRDAFYIEVYSVMAIDNLMAIICDRNDFIKS